MALIVFMSCFDHGRCEDYERADVTHELLSALLVLVHHLVRVQKDARVPLILWTRVMIFLYK